jgi:hypothetical protein
MWDVFPSEMGLDSNVELVLATLDINEPTLESITFDDDDDDDLLEGSSSTPLDAHIGSY